jgi:hypothetical protein
MPDELSLVTASEPTPIMLRYSESGGIVGPVAAQACPRGLGSDSIDSTLAC